MLGIIRKKEEKEENKKWGLHNYLEYSFNSILNISHRSGYRALDPNLAKTVSDTVLMLMLRGTLRCTGP